MPRKIYTPEQRIEKRRERARNAQRKRTLKNRIIRYSCFLINQDYTVLRNEEYDKIMKANRLLSRSVVVLFATSIILLIWLLVK